jgi:hypothetical protein
MFDLKAPCADCPFLKAGGIRLTPPRARQVARYFTDTQGGTFPCHKTVKATDDDDEARPMRRGEQLCMGGILFADRLGRANQMVRIGERTGFDITKVAGRDLVFDSLAQMLKTAVGRVK